MYPRQLFTDSKGIHHLLVSDLSMLEYWQLSSDGNILFKNALKDRSIDEYEFAEILGNNKNELYVIITGRLAGNMYVSNIYFTESFDNGKTWSSFQILTNSTNEEKCLKKTYSFTHIPSTGRLFIFYHLHCDYIKPTIRFITRPPSSKIFSQSTPVYILENYEPYWPSVVSKYSIIKGKIRIHLFWQEIVNQTRLKIMTAYSDNYGILWSEPKNVIENLYIEGIVPLEVSTNENIDDVILGTFYNS